MVDITDMLVYRNDYILVLEGLVALLRPRPLHAAAGVRVGAAPAVVELRSKDDVVVVVVVVIGGREVGDEGVAARGLPEELVGHQPRPENLAISCMCAHSVSNNHVIGQSELELARKMRE